MSDIHAKVVRLPLAGVLDAAEESYGKLLSLPQTPDVKKLIRKHEDTLAILHKQLYGHFGLYTPPESRAEGE